MPRDLIFIAGPTAVGKSEIALLLAEQLRGEIISVDSMQVYRGMDIGTAKPSMAERERVAHHLIDVLDISDPFDAGQFVRDAKVAVEEIHARGHIAIFCGGTGLYFKAFLEGLGSAPPANGELRKALEKTSPNDLLAELERVDRETYEKIDRRNLRRVIRAVEVIRLTGKPFSHQRASWKESAKARPANLFVGLKREVEDLRQRINWRVDRMFRDGLVLETERLLNQGMNQVAMQALGYRQVIDHLQKGVPLEQTIELVKLRTRQFAKRQMTWFLRQMAMKWLEVKNDEPAGATAGRIRSLLQKSEF